MTDRPDVAGAPAPRPDQKLHRWGTAAILAVLLGLCIAGMAAGYFLYYPRQLGPAQPIAFSHRVHVADKQISCLFCHPGSVDGERAGVPPVQTCALCHSRIIITHPQIVKLWDYYDRREPVPWVRVNELPDYVFFDHQVHTRYGFDCNRCHGDVSSMDRVRMATIAETGGNDKGGVPFEMGFCVQCHRDNQASVDCLTCHR